MDNFVSINLHNEIKMNKSTYIYIALFLLTSFTLFLGNSQSFDFTFIAVILIIAVIKGQIIIDYFMGLKNVELKYRMILSIWLLFIMTFIGIAYFLPIKA